MIEAKGSKEAAVNTTAERDRYVSKSGEQRLSIPIALGALMVGIASYLKSVVPVRGAAEPEEKPAPKAVPPAPAVSKNQARALQQKAEQLESRIEETEIAIASLEGRMAVPGFYDDAQGAAGIVKTHEELKAKLETLYREWEAISERVPAG